MPTLNILMCTHNGGAFLDAQLQSFIAQDHLDWCLWVSDDGSRDNTGDQLAAFAAAHPNRQIKILDGPRKGSGTNFLSLLGHPELTDGWVAFADQDDVWMPHKLTRACAQLETHPNAVYASRTLHTNANLRVIKTSPHHRRSPAFGNALVQNVMGGNTIVMPPMMTNFLQSSLGAAQAADVPFHDWWVYLMVTGAGHAVINDSEPGLYYRQHSENLMGAGRGNWRSRWHMLRSRAYAGWIDCNLSALANLKECLTSESIHLFEQFVHWRACPPQARRCPKSLGLYRQTKTGDLILRALARSGRL